MQGVLLCCQVTMQGHALHRWTTAPRLWVHMVPLLTCPRAPAAAAAAMPPQRVPPETSSTGGTPNQAANAQVGAE